MQKLVWIFTLTVLLFAFQDAAFSQDDSMFRLRCSLNKGDTVDKVKKFYNISSDPKKWDRPTPGGTAYQYHFPEYGVWVFLNPNLQISSLRFDRPFAGKIGDVAIGDTKDDVLRIKGKPGSESDGLPDQEVMEKRGKLKRDILDALPDPAPKRLVMKAFEEIAGLDASPPAFCTAWIYKVGTPSFERYEFGSLSGRVQSILSGHGTTE
jgi:hypothetical protein